MKNPCLLVAAAAALLAASSPAPATEAARLEPAADCAAAAAIDGARCAILHVPEDRGMVRGRTVPLHFAVVPGEDPTADPILFIAGGPGQSAIDVMPAALPDIRAVDRRRDVIFLDQRGTGRSNPLGCADGFELLEGGPDSPAFVQCVAALRERAALDRYGTADAVADIEALRVALGRPRLTLLAGSYGTRVAVAYMRDHPRRVRAAILRAAAPLDFNIIAGGIAAADSELGRVLDECEADAACNSAFPRLEERLWAMSARLAASPEAVSLTGPDGTGEAFAVTSTLFHQTLYALLLSAPTRQQIPLIIATAEQRGFQPLAPLLGQVRHQLYGALPIGMYLGVVCAEDAPRIGAQGIAAGRTPLIANGVKLAEACRGWPVPPAPAAANVQPRLATPTLVLTGALDPATNAAEADRLAERLSRGVHVIVPATAHGPLFPECVRADVARFLEGAPVEGVRPDCSSTALPPFALPPAARAG